ncbi:MAG: OmpA family protein, partial [Thermoanaerobaculia bacterium]
LQVRQLDADGNRLWALARPGAGAARSLWSLETAGDEPRREWAVVGSSGFPAAEDWRQAVWAEIIGGELWWTTQSGVLWRVSLNTPVWRRSELTPGPSSIRVSDDGVVWWLDADRTLHAKDPDSGRTDFIGSYVVEMQSHEVGFTEPPQPDTGLFWVLLVILAAAALAMWALGEWQPGSSLPFWLCVFGALVAGVLLWVLGTSRLPLPTRQIRFAQSVEHYWLDGDEVTVETAEQGRWRFDVDGTQAALRGRQEVSWQPPADGGRPPPRDTGWRVSVDGGLRIQRRGGDGTWQPVERGEQGFLHDQVDSFAVAGGVLFAATPAGVAEYRLGPPLSWSRLVENVGGGSLTKESGTVWVVAGDPGSQHWHRDPQGRWLSARPPWPRRVEEGGFRWIHQPRRDDLPKAGFDSASGRFRSDVAVGLRRDREGRGWIETPAGWRLVMITDDRVELGEPRLEAPDPAPTTATWKLDQHWSCSREEQPWGGDEIGLRLADLPPVDDPFGDLGRWPDLHALAVLPTPDATWIGTAAGVRRRDADGTETLHLRGRRIERLERGRDGSLYCRTAGAGDYRWNGGEWLPAEPADEVFGDTRVLGLELGERVKVAAEEHFEGGIELLDFRFDRFLHDAVEEVVGTGDGFWARTPAGVERLRLRGTEIAGHRGHFRSRTVSVLLRGQSPDSRIFARTADGRTWSPAEDRGWSLADRVVGNPFTTTREGRVSDIVSWQRQPGSNRAALVTAAGSLSFENGKLTSDWVTAVGGVPGNRLQATRAGILTAAGMIPNPPGGERGEDFHLAISRDRGQPWVRVASKSALRFDGIWLPASVSEPTVARARFDGLAWELGQVSEDRPRVAAGGKLRTSGGSLADGSFRSAGLVLDGAGRFRFDVVRSVAGRSDRLWLAHDAGLIAFDPDLSLSAAELFIPGRELLPALAENPSLRLFSDLRQWLWATGSSGGDRAAAVSESGPRFRPLRDGEQELLDALSQPQWHGLLGGSEATIELAGSHALEIESERTLRTFDPLPDGVVALSGAGSDVLILTAHGLQRLEAGRLPRRSLGRPPSVCSFEPIYFDFRQRELAGPGLARIARIAELLNGPCRDVQLWVDGYTDHLGTREGNAIMSIKRAGKVVDALVDAGVERSRMRVRAFGDRTARTDTDDPDELAGDRRVEINVRE